MSQLPKLERLYRPPLSSPTPPLGDAYITAINPEPERTRDPIYENLPIQSSPDEQEFTAQELHGVIDRVQKHIHNTYYLRKKLGSKDLICRFYFPEACHNEPLVTKDLSPLSWMYDEPRNDEWLNNYRILPVAAN